MEFPHINLGSFGQKNEQSEEGFPVRYVDDGSPVRYMDSSALKRPFSMPLPFKAILGVFVIAAAVIGGLFLANVYDDIVNAPLREMENTQKNVTKEVPLQLPVLTSLIQLDDETINNVLAEGGYTLYDMNSLTEGGASGIDVIKLPEGMSIIDAGIAYGKGVSKLSSSEAAKLLNGSWRYSVSRGDWLDMKVKYADFSSGSIEAALQNAIAAEGLGESSLGEAGVDNAGNTYQKGSVDVNGTIYQWQISVCPLSEVYSVDGLPDTAAYVGIRMYL